MDMSIEAAREEPEQLEVEGVEPGYEVVENFEVIASLGARLSAFLKVLDH